MSQPLYLKVLTRLRRDCASIQDLFARVSLFNAVQSISLSDLPAITLPFFAFFLWSLSLQHESVRSMNDLGMVSTFPPLLIVALVLMVSSFCLALRRPHLLEVVLLLHIVLLICMLYGIENIVEEAPRFSVVYRHAGYTEYIMRTGSVNPDLDTYFSWPGFFILSALLTQLAGYHDILAYAGWAPVFFNLIALGPLYLIFTALTTNRRLIWLSLGFFFLTNWIGQDYFSPQGLNFFIYLVLIAILLTWFQVQKPGAWGQYLARLCAFAPATGHVCSWLVAPATCYTPLQKWQRGALLVLLLTIFAFSVYSHPLTPFFVLASVIVLVLFQRCRPRWLPFVLALMVAVWIVLMARPFLVGHTSMVVGNVGQLSGAVTTNVTGRVHGDPAHTFITTLRVVMAGLLWLCALAGGIRRLRQGHSDSVCILLALAPFPLLVAQQYGGEMFLRIYLFSLPFMVFLAAACFIDAGHLPMREASSRFLLVTTLASLLLLGGFLFTRYGNERMDYVTYQEATGVRYLYHVARPGALFLGGWNDTPWLFKDYERYSCDSLADVLPTAVAQHNVAAIVQFIKRQHRPQSFVILTRAQEAQAEAFADLPPGVLDRLGVALEQSGQFTLIYHTADVQVFLSIPQMGHEK